MAELMNCTACQHPMSRNASICPNCHKPRLVGNTRQCTHCGTTTEKRKRKCPGCGIFFNANMKKDAGNTANAEKGRKITFLLLLALLLILMSYYLNGEKVIVPNVIE